VREARTSWAVSFLQARLPEPFQKRKKKVKTAIGKKGISPLLSAVFPIDDSI